VIENSHSCRFDSENFPLPYLPHSVDKCFHRPNATFLFLSSILCTLFYNMFRPHAVILRRSSLTKIVALSLQFNRVWNALLISVQIL
jgi:hypothetical protein